MCCLDIWCHWEGFRRPHGGPLPTLQLRIRSPSQTALLITGTRRSSCLVLSSGLQFLPAHGIIPARPPRAPRGTRGAPHSACLLTMLDGGGPSGPAWRVQSPPRLSVCDSSLLSSSSAPPPVSGVRPPRNLQAGILTLSTGTRRQAEASRCSPPDAVSGTKRITRLHQETRYNTIRYYSGKGLGIYHSFCKVLSSWLWVPAHSCSPSPPRFNILKMGRS